MSSRYLTLTAVQALAKRRIGSDRGANKRTAALLGMSPTQLWNELNFHPGKRLLDWLGIEKVTQYRYKAPPRARKTAQP